MVHGSEIGSGLEPLLRNALRQFMAFWAGTISRVGLVAPMEASNPCRAGLWSLHRPSGGNGSAGTICRWFRFRLNHVLRRASAAALRHCGRCATIRRRRLWQGVACVAFPHRHLHCISESLPNFACFLLFILPMFHVEHFYEISPLTVKLQLRRPNQTDLDHRFG